MCIRDSFHVVHPQTLDGFRRPEDFVLSARTNPGFGSPSDVNVIAFRSQLLIVAVTANDLQIVRYSFASNKARAGDIRLLNLRKTSRWIKIQDAARCCSCLGIWIRGRNQRALEGLRSLVPVSYTHLRA